MIALSSFTISGLVVAVLALGVLLVMLKNMVNIVQQGEVGVVKRLGEYRKTHEPGLVIIAPFIDGLQRVDMREIPVPGDRPARVRRSQADAAGTAGAAAGARGAAASRHAGHGRVVVDGGADGFVVPARPGV